jgi:hypothetical protein
MNSDELPEFPSLDDWRTLLVIALAIVAFVMASIYLPEVFFS